MSKNKSNDDMIGFKDFIENDKSTNKRSSNQRIKDFELMTFLEQESKRLTKHIEMLEEKVYVIKNFSQGEKLLRDQERKLAESKKKLIEMIKKKDSSFMKQMNSTFREYFNF